MKPTVYWALPVYPVLKAKKSLKNEWKPLTKNIAGHVLKDNPKSWLRNLELLYLTSRSLEERQPKTIWVNGKRKKHIKKYNHG